MALDLDLAKRNLWETMVQGTEMNKAPVFARRPCYRLYMSQT
jgi:hypothetical protein